jgi:hypothetical protein
MVSRCDQLRAQELELNTEIERIEHLRRVMASEPGHSEEIVAKLGTELRRLRGHLDECRAELAGVGLQPSDDGAPVGPVGVAGDSF